MATCKFNSALQCREGYEDCGKCSIFRKTGQVQFTVKHLTQDVVIEQHKQKQPEKPKTQVIVDDKLNMQVMCPYCLTQDALIKFMISTKKGYHIRNAKCPHCKNGTLIQTLTDEMTPIQYAQWVVTMTGYGFWQKINFETWKQRLFEIGWAQQFWNYYKENKPKSGSEEYEDHINKAAREAYEAEKDVGE